MWGFVLFCSLLFSGKRRDVEAGNEEALLKNEEKNVGVRFMSAGEWSDGEFYIENE